MRVANVFHAGDGNLHPLVLYDGEEQAEHAEELAGKIVEACVDAGGSITGEHGVGVDKKRYMPSMFEDADLAAFQHLRCAFDPRGLANPGKVMPTPRLCGEVPGPYRIAPARARRDRGAVLRAQGVRSETPADGAGRGRAAAGVRRRRRRRADRRRGHEAVGQPRRRLRRAAAHGRAATRPSNTTAAT